MLFCSLGTPSRALLPERVASSSRTRQGTPPFYNPAAGFAMVIFRKISWAGIPFQLATAFTRALAGVR